MILKNASGYLDPNFAAAGTLKPTPNSSGLVDALAVDGQERLIYALWEGQHFWLYRSLEDGSADSGFGKSGVVKDQYALGLDSRLSQILLQTDNKIVAIGEVREESGKWRVAVARYHPDGSNDLVFGKRIISLPSDAADQTFRPTACLDKEGGIVIAISSSTPDRGPTGWLSRLLPNGERDNNFGSENGYSEVRIGGETVRVVSIGVQSSGRIVVAGSLRMSVGEEATYGAMAGFLPSGQVDSGFGNSGGVISDLKHSSFSSLAVDKDYLFVAGQASSETGDPQAMVAKYIPSGAKDLSFNGGEHIATEKGLSYWFAVKIQPLDGKVLVAGALLFTPKGEVLHARLTTNGQLDVGYADKGFGEEGGGSIFSAVVQSKAGRLIMGGDCVKDGSSTPCLYGIKI